VSLLGLVVLAAGEGKRMKSRLPKVLHKAAGREMVRLVLDAAQPLNPSLTVIVTGYGAEQVRQELANEALFADQPQQVGTADAVAKAAVALAGNVDDVMVLCGDTPLLRNGTLQDMLALHRRSQAGVTLLSTILPEPYGYGRVKRNQSGEVLGIVEEADATAMDKKIHEINSGVYCFRSDWLWKSLPEVKVSAKGEYYLTDVVAMAVESGEKLEILCIEDAAEVMGVNDRVQLAAASRELRRRTAERLMLSGVTIIDPDTAYIDAGVNIGQDTAIFPNTTIEGRTTIGRDCRIGPDSQVIDATIGDGCRIWATIVESSEVGTGVTIGPFSHLRPGAKIAGDAHVGNFAEIKSSTLGERTHVGHFSYIGDSEIGADVNIGAGTVTCNYDGVNKNKTIIGDGVLIGSDTMLVAPVRIGRNARTGAGSVVTRDVAEGNTVYGVPARENAPKPGLPRQDIEKESD
jgi:bifunctional UDP-N-acetylglucosamine pyrophosphorylase / glucosamine-1-phosphate N-acetyltransferase